MSFFLGAVVIASGTSVLLYVVSKQETGYTMLKCLRDQSDQYMKTKPTKNASCSDVIGYACALTALYQSAILRQEEWLAGSFFQQLVTPLPRFDFQEMDRIVTESTKAHLSQ